MLADRAEFQTRTRGSYHQSSRSERIDTLWSYVFAPDGRVRARNLSDGRTFYLTRCAPRHHLLGYASAGIPTVGRHARVTAGSAMTGALPILVVKDCQSTSVHLCRQSTPAIRLPQTRREGHTAAEPAR